MSAMGAITEATSSSVTTEPSGEEPSCARNVVEASRTTACSDSLRDEVDSPLTRRVVERSNDVTTPAHDVTKYDVINACYLRKWSVFVVYFRVNPFPKRL